MWFRVCATSFSSLYIPPPNPIIPQTTRPPPYIFFPNKHWTKSRRVTYGAFDTFFLGGWDYPDMFFVQWFTPVVYYGRYMVFCSRGAIPYPRYVHTYTRHIRYTWHTPGTAQWKYKLPDLIWFPFGLSSPYNIPGQLFFETIFFRVFLFPVCDHVATDSLCSRSQTMNYH